MTEPFKSIFTFFFWGYKNMQENAEDERYGNTDLARIYNLSPRNTAVTT